MTARTFSTLKTLFQGRDPQDWVDDLMDSIKGGGFVPIPLTALSEIVSNNIWRPVGSGNEIGTIQVPLTAVREVASNNIPDAAGIGGILASDTTPILQFTNGDTDSALRLNYAATVVDPITFQVVLPDDLDEGQNIVINVRAAMSNTNDTPTLTAETFFNEGDTKVSDASAAVTGATVADYAITIAAADVPSGARTMSVELTPGAHGTDILYVYGIWVEYSVLATPALGYINGDTDSALRLTWAAGNTDKVAVQVPLPPDLDADSALELHLRAAMAATNDTPTVAVESFFNEGDTKVSDASAAITGATYAEYTVTIAAADVPTGAQTVSLELTPAAHGTDALYVTALWLEYTRA